MSDFIHLHVHSEYSLLDGAIKLKDLCSRTKDFGLPAVALTDHGNMHGAATFFTMAKDFGVKPIIGCEVYVASLGREDRTPQNSRYHLVLLAKDLVGYRNLLALCSRGYLEGFHYKPRVDKELLWQYREGIVAMSACLAGEIPRKLLREGMDAGIAAAREYAEIFPDNFYLELQANGLEEQFQANEMLLQVAEKTKLPLVATNDCHYLDSADVEAHDVLLCIQTASCVTDENRMRFGTNELWYRAPGEMEKEFSFCKEAIENTSRIAEKCNVTLDLKSLHFPVYELPEGMTLESEFRQLARDGLKERLAKVPYEVDEKKYWERLDYELDVICKMEFPGYFLIVQDFINWAKRNKIPVGPGRGSAAGSIVAWALRITNLDPLPYDLLFERFLNVERVSMPDIDVDFCERRRHEVIQYVSDKYGKDKVAQITTFGTMKAKAAVKDVGRALGLSFADTNRIAKLIPEDLKMTIAKALDQEPELRRLYDTDAEVRKLMDISMRLEGLSRHASTHAAGVVISPGPMVEYLPIYKDKKESIVTQFDMKRVEKVGLVKFDFLGLRTMTVIEDALDNIEAQGLPRPDLETLSLDDPDTYALYSRGDTDGIFQVESSGMRKYLQMLRPSCFEDIIAMLALYRPGPLGSGMVDEFIKRKHGEIPVTYPHPSLEDTLKPTYGVIVYQEQVMAIAMILAKYSLGEGDLLRRAMGKKIAEEMAKQRERFLSGARENEVSEETANEVFDLMEKFAAYGFNKSHSAAYALISYHTAWLKAHHKKEFMAALMTSELENQDKILKYVNACRDLEIPILPPDVNASVRQFSVDQGSIRYGLGGVKNVGDEAIREIVAAREEEGKFTSLLDLCLRVNLRKVTKRVLESLIKCGCMDGFGVTRAALIAGLDRVVPIAQKRQKDKDSDQISLLGMVSGGMPSPTLPGLGVDCPEQTLEEWPDEEKLKNEKESLGFYLTSHPLLAYRQEIRRAKCQELDQCAEFGGGAEVRTAVIITAIKEYITKKGDKMAFLTIEDLTGSGEMTVFPDTWAQLKPMLEAEPDQPILFTAKVSDREGDQPQPSSDDAPVQRSAKLVCERARPLREALSANDEPVRLAVSSTACSEPRLTALKNILGKYPGRAPINLELTLLGACCRLRLGQEFCVAPSPEFWKELEAWQIGR